MVVFLGIIGLLIIAATPADLVVKKLIMRQLEAYQAGAPIPHVYFSRSPYVVFGSLILDFLKGFCGFWAMSQLFGLESWFLLPIFPLLLLSHYRSFFLKFEVIRSPIPVILGLYCFMSWPLGVSFICGFLVLSLLLNSFLMGLVSVVLFQFWCIWTSELDPMFFFLNFMIFIFLIFIHHRELFSHIEGNPITILHSYQNR